VTAAALLPQQLLYLLKEVSLLDWMHIEDAGS
jgi:hypothetical protein